MSRLASAGPKMASPRLTAAMARATSSLCSAFQQVPARASTDRREGRRAIVVHGQD
jgi:hypothetical protein